MRHSFTRLLILAVALGATPIAQAQERDWSDEDYARQRIREIGERLVAGQRTVAEHDSLVVLHATAHGIDPDWLRAIIMVEATRPSEEVGTRAAPTGIDAAKWEGLDGATAGSFLNPGENVRLAALLLQRIVERVPEESQSLRFIASLYDDIATRTVTPYGATVERVFMLRGWERRDPPE